MLNNSWDSWSPWNTTWTPDRMYAYVRLYRVAPKACVPKSALANIVACTHELSASGIGLEIGVSGLSATFCVGHLWEPARCPRCKAAQQSVEDRREVAQKLAKKLELEVWRNSTSVYRASYLHICRGAATKKTVRLARIARKSAAEMLRARGYEVRLTDDEGGTRKLAPKKRRTHARR